MDMEGAKTKIVLMVYYDGRKYHGLVPQDGLETIGGCIIGALKNSNLYLESPEYCGRTDAGVSAFRMTISVLVKSNPMHEYNYASLLNSFLPTEIRITAHAIVDMTFHAAFSCTERVYRYFFKHAGLDMEVISQAINILKECTNFKNLCTHSKEKNFIRRGNGGFNQSYYERKLTAIRIEHFRYEFSFLEVGCRGFIHNMVRKIFYVIKLVGERKMSLDELYAVVYGNVMIKDMAPPHGLSFFYARYASDLNWIPCNNASKKLKQSFESEILAVAMKANFLD